MRTTDRPSHNPPATVLEIALRRNVVYRALKVSAVVGTILVAINHADKIYAGDPPSVVALILTYCVPYCVSTYGAVTALCERECKGSR